MRKREEGEDEDEDEDEEVKIMEEVGDFEELMVWGHENIVGQDDALVKGIEEWIGFAEAVGPSLWAIVHTELEIDASTWPGRRE